MINLDSSRNVRHYSLMRAIDDPEVLGVHAGLVRRGLLAPVVFEDDEQAWTDCELASFAEHHLGDRTCPRDLDPTRRDTWQSCATDGPRVLPGRREFERCYWILDQRRPVGTVALASSRLGGVSVRLSSLYVYPASRSQGVGRRAVEQIRDALHAHGMTLRLGASWTWQGAVRLYLRMGLTVHGWKRELDFRSRPGETAPEITFDIGGATVTVRGPEDRQLLVEGERDGDRLVLRGAVGPDGPIAWDALSTLAVNLALEGWPLIRSHEHWERMRASDLGHPEALAYRITTWEAWARRHGWRVDTPRIPGLDYPSWKMLEARWKSGEE